MTKQPAGIGTMFSGVVRTYDLLNHLLSFGADLLWRRRAARSLSLPKEARVLDAACGTGDMGRAVARAQGGRVFGLDISYEMLLWGRRKTHGAGMTFVQARAEEAPFKAGVFDAVTMAFGIRNLPDETIRKKGLRELHRLLRPGGKLAILEFSPPRSRLLRLYIRRVLPRIGNLVSRSRAYTYLRDTIMEFPAQDNFARTMTEAGYVRVSWEDLFSGAAALYIGEKPL